MSIKLILCLIYNLSMIFYIMPLMFSIFYFYLQKIEDIYHRPKDRKVFKTKRDFRMCLAACCIPIVNIIITYIAIKTTIKGLLKAR